MTGQRSAGDGGSGRAEVSSQVVQKVEYARGESRTRTGLPPVDFTPLPTRPGSVGGASQGLQLARYDLQGSSDDVQPHVLRQRPPFGMLLEHTRRLPHQVDGRACDSPPQVMT